MSIYLRYRCYTSWWATGDRTAFRDKSFSTNSLTTLYGHDIAWNKSIFCKFPYVFVGYGTKISNLELVVVKVLTFLESCPALFWWVRRSCVKKMIFFYLLLICVLGFYNTAVPCLSVFAENCSQVYTELAIPVAFVFLFGRILQ